MFVIKGLFPFLLVASVGATPTVGQPRPDLLPPVVVGDNSGPVRLELGQLLEVRLPVQGGTGYSWSVDTDAADNLELVTQTTLHPLGEPRRMGSSQTQMFIFRAIGRGDGALRFGYRQPWERRVAPAKTVAMTVNVRR